MDAINLVPGDYAKIYGENGLVEDIRELYLEDIKDCLVHPYKYEPIQITSDILEKNGYVLQDWYYEQLGYPDITNMFTRNTYRIGRHSYYGKGEPDFNTVIIIQYVHELQHVLRIYGIDKKVIL